MIVKGLVGQFDAGRKNNRQVFFPFLQQLFGQPSLAAAATPFKIEKPSGPSVRQTRTTPSWIPQWLFTSNLRAALL